MNFKVKPKNSCDVNLFLKKMLLSLIGFSRCSTYKLEIFLLQNNAIYNLFGKGGN
jgi:hypothetical protein